MVLATISPGAKLPLHYHTGTAEAYTLSGSWHYLEYPDQLQTAGSYIYEPAESCTHSSALKPTPRTRSC